MNTKRELPEGIKNSDAYKLMDYRCEICKKVERIWNGRNAVSPFGIHCTCGGTMYHENWHGDIRNKNYVPVKGQRYFADFTKERAEKAANRLIKQIQESGHPFPENAVEDILFEKIHELMHGECSMDLLTQGE